MKKKFLFPFASAIVMGFVMGFFLFQQYDKGEALKPVFGNKTTSQEVSFLQVGVYSSKESMEENTKNIQDYIYQEKEGKFYVYVAISNHSANIEKLKGYFMNKGYNIYVKKITITNEAFIEALPQYDAALEKTTEDTAIASICNQVLTKYKELIDAAHQNEGASQT